MVSGTYQKFHAVHHGILNPGAAWGALLVIMLVVSTCSAAFADCGDDDASPIALHPDYATGARFGGLRLRGSVRLAGREVDGWRVHGLSGLGWSVARGRLYAVSDRGFLLHLLPRFQDGMLVGVGYCAAFPLRDPDGAPLRGRWRDAEGLGLRPATGTADEELLIAFEQEPRVQRYTVDGHYLGALALPAPLRDPRRYAHPNRALEAVTETRRFGVIVAPELPMPGQSTDTIPLTNLAGRHWPFRSLDPGHSGLVGLETLPDDNLLVLERRYVSPFQALIIALSRVTLPSAPEDGLQQRELARFDTTAGWSMDNFESIAHHEGNRYFMISDDNASPLQHSLLMYFEVLDEDAAPPAAGPPAAPLSRHRL